ncbi:hypothetical protein E2C01_080086 [Portunus trituberculatus]|uniref:Uncharacterized protein n=1 Tax=Portunus trituberculatus TaxID=210409 RepID=A0A5B7IV22_PORTR|nr:hypothetical protein [Portunus trituberculatus]
MVWLSPKSDT